MEYTFLEKKRLPQNESGHRFFYEILLFRNNEKILNFISVMLLCFNRIFKNRFLYLSLYFYIYIIIAFLTSGIKFNINKYIKIK